MAEHRFDIVCEIDNQEVSNALQQCQKEASQRYDLKDAKASFDYQEKNQKIIFKAKDDYKVKAIVEIFKQRVVKRSLSVKAFQFNEAERIGGDFAKIEATIQQGIDQKNAKIINKAIKDKKFKVQCLIQGDQLRVSSKKIDELQAVMQCIRELNLDVHTHFKNLQ